ncbi:hypothetical protein [Paraburkholderia susongensis]|uniref:Uncharacterized protein n=1 Tax=Paraburkholderia susongensis TaxID=1515439 RepID=A0A1X7JE07_9BURK|nr:hypothetical protein [Paraburkholderia susongensis]SMG26071.1 hypothetical protein SAMN06265784_102492 [Paraburkholderia susongensis]
MFDVDRWFHFALQASVPREAHDDLVEGMKEARIAWLRHAPSLLLSFQSYELRNALGESDNIFHMNRMDNHQVARALYNEIKDGNLVFVPERDEMRKCVEAIRTQREKGSRQAPAHAQPPADAEVVRSFYGNSPRVPRNLGNAQPFEYRPDAISDDMQDIAARGVDEAQEAECFAEYEARLDQCKLYRATTGNPYTLVACQQNAFRLYNQCRGF